MNDPKVIVIIENNRIKYLGHHPGEGEMFSLLIGGKVEKEFYEKIFELAWSYLEKMKPGLLYTVEEMCGEVVWSSVRPWNRNVAGLCVADAVKRTWLPLVKKPQHTRSYQTNLYLISHAEMLTKDEEV